MPARLLLLLLLMRRRRRRMLRRRSEAGDGAAGGSRRSPRRIRERGSNGRSTAPSLPSIPACRRVRVARARGQLVDRVHGLGRTGVLLMLHRLLWQRGRGPERHWRPGENQAGDDLLLI